jgi:hypothetical protein
MKLEELEELVELQKIPKGSKGTRTIFNESWISEMPTGLGEFETFDGLEYNIKEFIKFGIKIEDLGNNLKKIYSDPVMYYWYEKDGEIQLATELRKENECLIVKMTGKNPKLKGKPPYASDLYSAILKDTDKNIRLTSDDSLSDEGYGIWKKLFKLGYTISVYDISDFKKVGQSLISLTSIEDMDNYFKNDDNNYKKYQYVLSENGIAGVRVRSSFRCRANLETTSNMTLD